MRAHFSVLTISSVLSDCCTALASCVAKLKTRNPKRRRQITLTSITRCQKGKNIIKSRRVNLITRFDSDANCIPRYSPLMFVSRTHCVELRTFNNPNEANKEIPAAAINIRRRICASSRGERVKVAATACKASETVI